MKSILDNRPALKAEVMKIAEVAGYLWTNGWAERNGGNISGSYEVEGVAGLTFTGTATNNIFCKAQEVNLLSTGSGTANIEVDCEKMNVQAVGSGTLNLEGKAKEKKYLNSPLSEAARNVKLNDNIQRK